MALEKEERFKDFFTRVKVLHIRVLVIYLSIKPDFKKNGCDYFINWLFGPSSEKSIKEISKSKFGHLISKKEFSVAEVNRLLQAIETNEPFFNEILRVIHGDFTLKQFKHVRQATPEKPKSVIQQRKDDDLSSMLGGNSVLTISKATVRPRSTDIARAETKPLQRTSSVESPNQITPTHKKEEDLSPRSQTPSPLASSMLDKTMCRLLHDFFEVGRLNKITQIVVQDSSLLDERSNLLVTLLTNYETLPQFVLSLSANPAVAKYPSLTKSIGLPHGSRLADLAIQLNVIASVFRSDSYYASIDYRVAVYGLIQLAESSFVSVMSTLDITKAMADQIKDFAYLLETGKKPPGLQGLVAVYSLNFANHPTGVFDHAAQVARIAEEEALKRLVNVK